MSKNGAISFKIEGVSHLTTALRSISDKVHKVHLQKAVRKATRIVATAARKNIRKRSASVARAMGHEFAARSQVNDIIGRTGALERSIAVKIVSYTGGNIIGIVGPDRAHRIQVGVTTKPGKNGPAGTPIYHDPANIAHLVEYGHGGPHPAPPHPFMRPAWEESKARCLAAIRDTLEAGLAKELSK